MYALSGSFNPVVIISLTKTDIKVMLNSFQRSNSYGMTRKPAIILPLLGPTPLTTYGIKVDN